MSVTLTFKTPDVLDQLDGLYDEDELEVVTEVLNKFIKYGEYINVEFDIDSCTAKVLRS